MLVRDMVIQRSRDLTQHCGAGWNLERRSAWQSKLWSVLGSCCTGTGTTLTDRSASRTADAAAAALDVDIPTVGAVAQDLLLHYWLLPLPQSFHAVFPRRITRLNRPISSPL